MNAADGQNKYGKYYKKETEERWGWMYRVPCTIRPRRTGHGYVAGNTLSLRKIFCVSKLKQAVTESITL